MPNGILKGKKGIIFGALDNKSIAWKVAEYAHNEGAEIVLTNAPIALRMGTINELAEKTNSIVIPADATNTEDLNNLYEKAMEHLGGKIDFVLHSIGMSVNVRKGRHYTDQNYDFTMKGLDVSAMSFHKTMQTACLSQVIQNMWHGRGKCRRRQYTCLKQICEYIYFDQPISLPYLADNQELLLN